MNFGHLQERLEPVYVTSDLDKDVPLYEGSLELLVDALAFPGIGRIWLEWLPTAGVLWNISDLNASFGVNLGPAKLRVPGYANEIDVRITSTKMSSTGPTIVSGFIENGQGRQSTADLSYVIFSLANFIPFHGSFVRDSTARQASAARAVLQGGGWSVILENAPGFGRDDGAVGHFAISHVGRLTKEGGVAFRAEEAKAFFENLYWFLSFCSGRPTPAILPVGFDFEGSEVWSEWGAWNVAPFSKARNWFNDFSAEGLEGTFPGFWTRINDPSWKQPVQLSIYWYLEAERAGNDSSIVLSQAAFELLAWATLVEAERLYTPDDFEKLPFQSRLGQLINRISLDGQIPETLKHLKQLAIAENWDSGPASLWGIRNALVHPSAQNLDRMKSLTPKTLFEAAQLTLWYLELYLLWLFEYGGKYSTRLLLSGWKGQDVVPVPWIPKA